MITKERAVQIATEFLKRKRGWSLPVFNAALHNGDALPAAWLVTFDRRAADRPLAFDPCTVTVEVDPETGRPEFGLDL